jgi:hypothetical protein
MGDAPRLHLLKLCVGADGIEDLARWRERSAAAARAAGRDPALRHVTRMWPRRAAEVLRGGSLYWVFKGVILARNRILAFEPVDGEDGVRRCAIVLDDALVRTQAQPRRPFQGWRYLEDADAPPDLGAANPSEALPIGMAEALETLGVYRRRG